MANRPHPRRAKTNPASPRGWATCARCGWISNLEDLQWQWAYRGLTLMNTQLLVCQPCYDQPNRQLGAVILPPDPPGLLNARPEAYPSDEYWPRLRQGGGPRYLQGVQPGIQRARSLQYNKYFT